MLDDFMMRALLAGFGVALVSAPLGCFVVWRRMAYFGDATAHAAMLGVALSLAIDTDVFVGALILASLMAWVTTRLSGRDYSMDTLLGVLSHSFLAMGLVIVAFLQGVRIDLMAYLFGDILAVSKFDLSVIWIGAFAILGLISWRWKSLFLAIINERFILRQRHKSQKRTTDFDSRSWSYNCGFNQSNRRSFDCRNVNHSRCCSPKFGS